MEVNGIANIKILVEMAINENTESHQAIDKSTADKILEQLDFLERYMIAYKEARDEYTTYNSGSYLDDAIPKWHEITANPEKYPTLKEMINGLREDKD